MSYKTILVHADAGPGCDRRVRLAMQVADLFDASLTGLGAEAIDPLVVSAYETASGMVVEALREQVAADIKSAERHFRDLTSGRQGLAWIAVEDRPAEMLALCSRGADLIVASRPARHESGVYTARPADLVLRAGGPVLLAADGEAPFRGARVVIAWKDTRESRRAVSDALPFLMRASRVVIVAAGESSEAALHDVAKRLARHGVQAETEMIPSAHGRVAEALEDAANRHSADLIVVGAYGHSHIGEWVLGGVTEDFLARSNKFLLLSH